MPTNIVTTEDLKVFKEELLSGITELLNQQQSGVTKKWLKSTDVMKMLEISPGTLQNLRINGTLPFSKIGGLIYYDVQDIQEVLSENKVYNKY
ncbi:helix-turn-helix domain-containing protein [Christiangramia marina]|uniref:helix-turn-helix domain-containing protein n=1 Tax=Christiangramia marina TaxID=409436 RepID=UPI003AA7C289